MSTKSNASAGRSSAAPADHGDGARGVVSTNGGGPSLKGAAKAELICGLAGPWLVLLLTLALLLCSCAVSDPGPRLTDPRDCSPQPIWLTPTTRDYVKDTVCIERYRCTKGLLVVERRSGRLGPADLRCEVTQPLSY